MHEFIMKTLKGNKKLRKNQGGILTELLISLLIIALEYQTSYQSSAPTLCSYIMARCENKFILIFINFNENIRN